MPEKREIVRAARCIFPNGRAVLMGYDAEGKEVLGLGIKTESVRKWAMAGVTKADLARLKKAQAEG